MSLVQIDNNQPVVAHNSFSGFFINSAFAQQVTYEDYIDCALVAIGADVLFSWSSMGTSWSVAEMKKAFGAVVKRALGPIGAAITAVSFGM